MENKERTVEEIHQEYSQLCARAGHLQYTIVVTSDDLKVVNDQLKALNFEAAKLAADKEVKAKANE